MGRIFKQLVFWAPGGKPQVAKIQIDTGSDRTILATLPPGAKIKGQGCVNQRAVHLVDIIALIPDTMCLAAIEAVVPKRRGSLPTVIGADFLQATRTVLDYDGEVIGCPKKSTRRRSKGFAGASSVGLLKFQRGACRIAKKPRKKKR
jgi:hypothetical protein